ERERQEDLQLTHGVAGEDGLGPEAPSVPGSDPKSKRSLAGRGGRGRQFERGEVEVPEQKEAEQPDHDDHFGACRSARARRYGGAEDGHQGEGEEHGDDDAGIEEKSGGALPGIADVQTQVDAFGRDKGSLRSLGGQGFSGHDAPAVAASRSTSPKGGR